MRTPRYKYKIRKLTPGNKTGENFGITVPKVVAEQFKNVHFYLTITNNSMIYESGCSLNYY